MFNRKFAFAAVFALVMVLAVATYAFAAANNVDPSKAGDGSGAITGYNVSAIHYVVNATTPTIDSVTFTLNSTPAAGSTIRIKLVSSGNTWYTCTNSGANVTCNNGSTLGAPIDPANSLEVVITD